MNTAPDTSSRHGLRFKEVTPTDELLTGRAGLSALASYLEQINILVLLAGTFAKLRLSRKGLPLEKLFKQLLLFFFDGTRLSLSYFDQLAADPAYAATIQERPENLASSHQIKRFFRSFSFPYQFIIRRCLQRVFLWRLQVEQPEVIRIDMDAMVMNNDDARKREGVKPTYKKVNGFAPLQVIWNGYVADAVFRSGHRHSNYSDTVAKAITHLVTRIRRDYRANVVIILTSDSGFYDEENFALCEQLGIAYVGGGRMHADIQAYVQDNHEENFERYESGQSEWRLLDFAGTRKSWTRWRRTIYSQHVRAGEQYLLDLPATTKPTVVYTNLGVGNAFDQQLREAGKEHWLHPCGIVELAHSRGESELANRGIKDFGGEKLPFRRFNANAAFYYLMLIALNVLLAFRHDVLREVPEEILPAGAYPSTIRRVFIDIAGRIVTHSRQRCLRIFREMWDRLNLAGVWQRLSEPFMPIVPCRA